MTTRTKLPAGLYGITPEWSDPDRLVMALEAAIKGGLQVLQLRHKTASDGVKRNLAEAILPVCRAAGVPLIINDDWRLAQQIGADGVHLGRDDDNPADVRAALSDNIMLGVSCYADLDRAMVMASAGVDYVAFGAMFASGTKPQAPPAPLSILSQARGALASLDLSTAIVAIGGITPENAAAVFAAGADSVAVVGGLFLANDIEAAARRFCAMMPPQPHKTERNAEGV